MTWTRGRTVLAVALVGIATMAAPVNAQITTGSVVGTITDAQGGALPGASVTLVSATKGTKSPVVVTNETGDFVVPNTPADTYTIEVVMSGFKTLNRSGITVNAGSRTSVGRLTLDVGGVQEVVDVTGEAPLIQATSGERSFTVQPDAVQNLPIATRSFDALASLAPGVSGTSRIGGGGDSNFMMDGVSTLDTGSNRLLMQVNVESIAEVKVLTSNYQAEYGRSSGLQMTAVTKSGTNQFHGSLYDVENNSDWGANSKTNILNGNPKPVSKSREWGYSIGGPVGKPGGNNKLFFFYAHEFQPLTSGGNTRRFRMPTALERAGDFSQSYDNLGNRYPYIKDPTLAAPCSASNTAGCFADGGVLGRVPANRLYAPGIAVLNQYPLPNMDGAGLPYNYQITAPVQHLLAYQPVIKIDYQPKPALRASVKYAAWDQRAQVILGTLPGFNDTIQPRPIVSTLATTVDYSFSPTTFFEVTYGHSTNEEAGCALRGGAPVFCQSGIPTNDISNMNNAGLGDLPLLFPDATVLDHSSYAYEILNGLNPPFWDGTRILKAPTFQWGNRVANAPPSILFPGFLNTNPTQDVSVSLTKVAGAHTLKAGFYNTHSVKKEQDNSNPFFGTLNFANDTNNPFDTSFGYANAVLGIFDSYSQASSYVEGRYIYNNAEWYVQDNWKVNKALTLDYGLRFAHQAAQYDASGHESSFILDQYSPADAPLLYAAGCANGAYPCSGRDRQAMNPLTGALLGPSTALAIGTIVPDTGDPLNGIYVPGAAATYSYPAVGIEPRFGMTYDLTGEQRVVLRGGAGLFFDRPQFTASEQVTNPPATVQTTVQYGQLQTLGTTGLLLNGAPTISDVQHDLPLPKSVQWNGGVQLALPLSSTIDVEYVGQHAWDTQQSVNINAIDLGTAFLPEFQDPTLPPSAVPGATAVSTNMLRAIQGYGAIRQLSAVGWSWYHSIQISLQRRFTHGLSFGFVDTIGLSNTTNTTPRLEHNADGTYTIRSDQAQADALLGTNASLVRHTMNTNFVWTLPTITSQQKVLRALAVVANDWQIAGIWTASTGSPYTVGFSYQSNGSSINLTGSPDYAARVRINGDPGAGCSDDRFRQFNTAAFLGPAVGSVGLDSGVGYLDGCFSSVLNLSLSRTIRLGGSRSVQLRVDAFNAPNQASITGRNTTMTLANPNAPDAPLNLPFDANGNLITSRSLPSNAGFGVANGYQVPRTVQAQIRFSF
ncbi:MAG TPA: carboxypeptidase-like regulatory domain-containing protein [Vicinamibacterales bacterium]|nr:carboxypeptidase-like regulatory domain-containing protein [Vicinamibacterales bacterium]